MEARLKNLFDFQKFANEPELQRVIDQAHARRGARLLSLDEADMVNAAGDKYVKPENADPLNQPDAQE